MDFSIIIVNYNLTQEIRNCIDSLLIAFGESKYEVILVDNNSEDQSIVTLAAQLKNNSSLNFTFVSSSKNVGFGNACNLAVQQSRGKILFFLNPDTIVKQKFLEEIKTAFETQGDAVGVVGLNVSSSSLLDYSAGVFPNLLWELLNVFLIGRFIEALYIRLRALLRKTPKFAVDWVMGSALFIKKELFENVKGFDSDYFLYFEEMDLCKRVKNAGYSVIYYPSICVEHLGSVSSKKNYYFFTKMFYKGKLLFLKKHSTEVVYKVYSFLLSLQFIVQILIWHIMKFRDKNKSLGKKRAFKELIKLINNPESISNRP